MKLRRLVTFLLVCCLSLSVSSSVLAKTETSDKQIVESLINEGVLTAEEASSIEEQGEVIIGGTDQSTGIQITTDNVTALKSDEWVVKDLVDSGVLTLEEILSIEQRGEVIIGGTDQPMKILTDELTSEVKPNIEIVTGVGRVNSYATYSSANGVKVYITVYAPWYYPTNPKFTKIHGSVGVKFSFETWTMAVMFYGTANGERSISTSVDTNRKAPSGTKGHVSVSGMGYGLNVLNGQGPFAISYDITVPTH